MAGHPAALAPGLLGVGLAIPLLFCSLLAAETRPQVAACVLPYVLKLGKENEEVCACVCVFVCVCVCVCVCACVCACVCVRLGKYQQSYYLSPHCNMCTDPPCTVCCHNVLASQCCDIYTYIGMLSSRKCCFN